MKESIHKYFQVGTIQWMSYPKSAPMDSLLEIARDDYFDAIELKGYGADNEKAKSILEQSHLKVCYGAQPRLLGPKLNPNAIDEEERKMAEKTLLEAVDEAPRRACAPPSRRAQRGGSCLHQRAPARDRRAGADMICAPSSVPFRVKSFLFAAFALFSVGSFKAIRCMQ